jgi:hypothetical protein
MCKCLTVFVWVCVFLYTHTVELVYNIAESPNILCLYKWGFNNREIQCCGYQRSISWYHRMPDALTRCRITDVVIYVFNRTYNIKIQNFVA